MSQSFFARANDIRVLLVDARLGEALEAIYGLARETAPDYAGRVVAALAARTHLESDLATGTISKDDHRVQLARLTQAAETFLRDLERRHPEFVDLPPLKTSVLEAIYGTSHLRSVGWLRRGLDLARSVVRVRVASSKGTGFLVAGGFLLTNHHVLPSKAVAAVAEVDFDYEADEHGRETFGPRARLAPDTWRSEPNIDCAVARLISLNGASFDDREALPFDNTGVPRARDRVSIIQHASGGPKQFAITANEVVEITGHTLRYATHTLPGSSGAPVFNERWEVVALHARGGNIVKNAGGEPFFANEGSLIGEVARVLGLANASGV